MNSLDTLGYCKRLEAVGVPREQAEVHAQILTEVMGQVATKDDLKELEVRLKEWVALYIKEQIAGVTGEIAGLRADIAGLKAEMLKWFVASLIAQSSLIIAALRYLPH
ncbi:hypothetical protein GTP45_25660 [Pseudoduganella sp. FT55W]|uniref:DUF1640 domain-containing protein n=1 Tax=Duganella rivi TaxID=2666083 RepID=A0A7X4KED8_9BURK|nr:hypothetical protein [Duganella rivi]MYM70165.1 hypothetical protein [Duganella rivi]